MVGMSRATLGVEAAPASPLSCRDGVWLQHQDSGDGMTDFKLPLVCLKRLRYCGWGSGETALGHIMGDVDSLTRPIGMPLLGLPEPWSSTWSTFPPPDLPPEEHMAPGSDSPSPACQVSITLRAAGNPGSAEGIDPAWGWLSEAMQLTLCSSIAALCQSQPHCILKHLSTNSSGPGFLCFPKWADTRGWTLVSGHLAACP